MKQRSYAELADIFDALERLAAGDPTVQLAEDGGDDPLSLLRRAINRSAQSISELVDTTHEFAMALAEHFDVLNRVAEGDLLARIEGDSSEEILACLKTVTNRTIENLASEILSKRRAEARLQESERRYRTLFEKSGDAMVLMGRERIADCNEAALALFGYGEKEALLGQHPAVLSPGEQPDGCESRGRTAEMVRRALATGSVRYRWVHRRCSGEVFPAEVLLTPVPMGRRRFIHAVIRDISEQMQAEKTQRALQKQLQQAQKLEAIGTLAGGIAHDFNNSLAPIIGYTELAMEDMEEGCVAYKNLGHVVTCAERARDLVRQILAFSRENSREVGSLPAAAVVAETIQLLRASLPSTVEIRSRIERVGTWVAATPGHIHQIVMNLCTNAAHAIEEHGGGVLEVALDAVGLSEEEVRDELELRAGQYVRLTVCDDGCGIPVELIDRIFEPFFTTKEVGQGSGMGLSMVHGVVHDLGGAVRVESAPGAGSRFQIFLPQVPPDAGYAQEAEQPGLEAGSGRILLVDDEQVLVDFMTQALHRFGYAVTGMTSSEDALSAFERDPTAFDLVITDQTIPRMTGMVLAERMLAIRPDLPIILWTGYSPSVTPDLAAAKGIRVYLDKPCSLDVVTAAIQQLLAA